jgi:hypothetical protein
MEENMQVAYGVLYVLNLDHCSNIFHINYHIDVHIRHVNFGIKAYENLTIL